MSFNRINYDNDAYDLKIERSTAPGDYRLFQGSSENCDKCLSYDGPRNAKSDVSLPVNSDSNQWGSMAEIESHLTNRVHILSEGNIYGKNDDYKNIIVHNNKSCNSQLIPEETRFTYPLESFRCMDLTSYHYSPFTHVNAQCEIREERIGLNSRLSVKDNFIVNKPVLIDQNSVLPPINNQLNNQSNNHVNNMIDVCKNY